MSYSYIKNVFPKYESSTINTEKLYNNLNLSTQTTQPIKNDVLAFDETEFSKFKKELINKTEEYQLTQTKLPIIEKFTQSIQPQPTSIQPHPTSIQSQPTSIQDLEHIHKYQNTCNNNLNHVMNCNKCRTIIIKQLNINNDRLRNEELMELFSYIIFSIFILLLIDFIKKI